MRGIRDANRLIRHCHEANVATATAQVDGARALAGVQHCTDRQVLMPAVAVGNVEIIEPDRALIGADLDLAVLAMAVGRNHVALRIAADGPRAEQVPWLPAGMEWRRGRSGSGKAERQQSTCENKFEFHENLLFVRLQWTGG
jgi:hypothetical protein